MFTSPLCAEEFLNGLQRARSGAADGPSPRWAIMAAAFADTGGWVSGSELADLISQRGRQEDGSCVSQPVSLVARWIVSGDVIAVSTPWGDMLPLFQFDLQRAAIRHEVTMVCAELRGTLAGADLAMWFVTPNGELQGEQPALALRTRLPEARRAARRVATGR
jgi:hypothetical protein